MERFAVGIDEEIYDFGVFEKTVGAVLTIHWFNRFKDFIIPHLCDEYNLTYKKLEFLVSRLKIEQEKKILKQEWISQGLCRHCGGKMVGRFTRKCKSCNRKEQSYVNS